MDAKSTSHTHMLEVYTQDQINVCEISPRLTTQTPNTCNTMNPAATLQSRNVPLSKSVKFTEFMTAPLIAKHNRLVIGFINLYCIGEMIFLLCYCLYQNCLKRDWYLVFLPMIIIVGSVYTDYIVKAFKNTKN